MQETDTDINNTYIKEIKEIKLLSSEEEVLLATKVMKGDEEARKRLIECNLRLVLAIANKYKSPNIPLDDLIQEGNLGLMKATSMYDYTKGYSFSTYATYWIKQYILRYVNEKASTIHISTDRQLKTKTYLKAKEELSQKLKRYPTNKELADYLNISIASLLKIKENNTEILSLNTPINDESNSPSQIQDFIVDQNPLPEDTYDNQELINLVAKMVTNDILNEKEKMVLTLRLGLFNNKRHTLKEVAEKLQVTHERIRQIELLALRKLFYLDEIKDLAMYSENPEKSLAKIGEVRNHFPKIRLRKLPKDQK